MILFIIIEQIVLAIVILLACAVAHEWGHIQVLKKYKYKYVFKHKKGLRFEITCIDSRITRKQDKDVLLIGILLGLLVIIFANLIGYNLISTIALMIIYIIFCLDDIKRLIKK